MKVPKKRFSQNFLTDPDIAGRIVKFLEISKNDTILEIGAGRGVLTQIIADSGAKLIAFEIDRDLIGSLSARLNSYQNVEIVNRDFLSVIPDEFTSNEFKLIGNIPYDITSPLLEWMLRFRSQISRAVLTTQKELADRISAEPGSKDWAPISIFHQCFFDIRRVMSISGGAFFPPPNVKSATLLFDAHPKYNIPRWENFEQIVRQSFRQRRKLLSNNLSQLPGMSRFRILEIYEQLGFSPDVRAEQLSITDFLRLEALISGEKIA